ncbi:MAG: TolC family outer membrane protein [Gammaproteobacteria bacterium]|nr:TolC family outer membrane protein [Gammaproteobacteria bacterium]MBU1446690.1 TolC family outer membrane protein [Gammaproteobacteria bacterium]MDD2929378.1 TolC family outer membrane protein [Sideroxydans sp.]
MKPSRTILSAMLAAAFAAPASAADLIDIYRAAQTQDAVFAAARAAQQAGQEKLSQGRALLMPSVNLNASTAYNDINAPYGASKYNSHGYGVTVTQPLFREQNWAMYNQSELQVVISEAQYKAAQQDVILRSAQVYFDVLIAQDTVQLIVAQKSAIAQQLEQAKRNFEVGTATVTDTYEAQARYDLILAQELAAASDLEVKQRNLQQLINADLPALNVLGAGFNPVAAEPADVQKWVEEAKLHNVQVQIAEAAYQLADEEVARSRGGHLPTLDLVGNYSKNTGCVFTSCGETRNTSVALQLNMPLFQGGATQSKWREADANREKARQDLENARRNVAVQTRQAYLGVATGIAQVQALQQALKSSESLLAASKLGQEVGVRTSLDVLNAQQQMYATRRDLYQAQYNYLVSHLRLKAAAGKLQEEDLVQVNQALH